MSNMRSFDQLYSIAPPSAVNRLMGFRERVPMKSLEIGKNVYRVWDMGQGEKTVVFIPSGMGNGEVWFPFMTELSADFRCVAVSLPACKTMEEYCRQLHELFAALGIGRMTLIGHAIGGVLVQVYLRMYPGEVESLILCMAGAPAKGLPSKDAEQWIHRRKTGRRFRFSPFNTMKPRLAYQTFESMCPPEQEDNLLFWRAFIAETYQDHVYKKQYIYLNCIAIPNMYERLPFEKGDLKGWNGRVLIFDADGDHYYSNEEKALLLELYEGARVEKLGSAGQLSLQADERQAVLAMRSFLRETDEGQKARV